MRKLLQWLRSLFAPVVISAPPVQNPAYIDYPNDYIIPIPGDYAKMQRIIDQRLNFSPLNKKVRFFPLSDMMIWVVSDIKKGFTLNQNYPKAGFLEEKGFQIFMPVVECTQNSSQQWVAQRILTFIPYIFIDQPFSLSIGRELFGFAKALASFQLPPSPAEATDFQVNAFGFKRFDQASPEFGAYHTLVNIQQQSPNANPVQWTSHNDAWQHLKQLIDPQNRPFKFGLPFLIQEIKDALHKTIAMIFLKQFRSMENPNEACYQAIVEGNGILDSFFGGGLLGETYEINIADFASFPIKEDLGVDAKIVVNHAFWLKANLRFDTGTVMWSSTQ
jgi:hypothetical protein